VSRNPKLTTFQARGSRNGREAMILTLKRLEADGSNSIEYVQVLVAARDLELCYTSIGPLLPERLRVRIGRQ
jgi:hypothetical protein